MPDSSATFTKTQPRRLEARPAALDHQGYPTPQEKHRDFYSAIERRNPGFPSLRNFTSYLHQVTLNANDNMNSLTLTTDETTTPPNFAEVLPGIYRSSFPKSEHFGHLRSLHLRTILTLVPEDYPAENVTFMRENGIRHFQIHIPGNKDTANISTEHIASALSVVLDRRNLPILIHCNKGKHRTGCVIACLRKLQNWTLPAVIQEYHAHADPKARVVDEEFIASYDESSLVQIACAGGFVPRMLPATGVVLPGDHDWTPSSPRLSTAARS